MSIPGPFRPWLWCVAWSIPIWSWLVYAVYLTPETLESERDTWLIEEATVEDGEGEACRAYLALGDSLLRCSFPTGARIEHREGPATCMALLWRFGARQGDFLGPRLKGELARREYTGVVIQSKLLFSHDLSISARREVARREAGRLARAALRPLFGSWMQAVDLGAGAARPLAPSPGCGTRAGSPVREDLAKQDRSYQRRVTLGPAAEALLEAATATSEHVVVLRLRRSIAWPPGRAEQARYSELEAELEARGVRYVELAPMSEASYADGEHANTFGAQERLRQLAAARLRPR